ncbi:MAG TPA: hypothetical protein VFS15_01165, partial [Kofleriaceae bacterium]|nr:hypothetical protein [Kofleriaceae bacterium]
KLNRDTDVTEYAVVRDTKGLAGMVDIGRVILERIQESAVFVADVSIINPKPIRREDERPTPNPNVMFELGYAYEAKGEDAIIAVFNTARGDVLELPFDVRPKRILTYHAASEADREKAKPKLVGDLVSALKLCLKDTEDTIINRNSIAGAKRRSLRRPRREPCLRAHPAPVHESPRLVGGAQLSLEPLRPARTQRKGMNSSRITTAITAATPIIKSPADGTASHASDSLAAAVPPSVGAARPAITQKLA